MKTRTTEKFNALQIEEIIEKTVNIIAADEDKEFFRGILHIKAQESSSSAAFSYLISTLLTTNS